MVKMCHLFVWLAVSHMLAYAAPLDADEKLQRACKENDFDKAGGELIEPSNRTTCALFAEQGLYVPYRLRVTERDGVTHLTGTVPMAGDYDGLLIACGQTGTARCLRLDSSPGGTMNGAVMFYSNAEVNLGIHQGGPVTYVASLDCKDGVPGQRYFEFRKAPSESELENIKTHFNIHVDSNKLSDCLATKDEAFKAR